MIRGLILTAILGALALAFTGCHAQAGGSVGGNDASSMSLPR